ncbi:hypothetical protein [Kitasatospora sp. McL0602]|uniref:hypothetical protein n=1 Tax=Kitasatospora sp. McL0602 TaxID=3439530 RepID=UPI003F8A75C9
MGLLDNAQAKKAQKETNARLDALIAEQRRTNELLLHLIHLQGQRQAAPQDAAPARTTWDSQQP